MSAHRRRGWCLLGTLAFALAVSGLASAQGTDPSSPPDDGVPRAIVGAVPVHIDIPSIDAHATVVALGEDSDGAMEAPSDPDTVGWYALGAGIGAPGNALLDGHVDWGGKLRAFGYLGHVTEGDEIQVTDVSANLLTYRVLWTRLYQTDAAPLDEIFALPSDEELTLITCGGAFDRASRMYLGRWVVRAVRWSPAVDAVTSTRAAKSPADALAEPILAAN